MTMIPIQHRMKVAAAPIFQALHQFECELRVAMPAIVVSFDPGGPTAGPGGTPKAPTVSVQPSVQEVILENGVENIKTIDILDDVPVSIYGGGGFSFTLPIKPGDECLVVFADMAFDHWFESGGIQKQPDGKLYRHDIGDAIAIFGLKSSPNALANYSTSSAQLRSDDGTVIIDIAETGITVTAPAVTVEATGGTPQFVATADFVNYFTTVIIPFLNSQGFSGDIPPATSVTTVLQAE